ncbi:signal peptide-containing protein [Cryptosporidium canis]|uniref:Signal peptide-containing protein n=1 Tax=Cryptosporidium canis TaxID=195482 RepID=A0ABQ8PCB6_9CRYT|nr:signal peptide-containing protein [Cryptosporidium canis]
MQPVGTFGVVPQVVNPAVVVVPSNNAGSGPKGGGGCCGKRKSKRKGSCSSCGRCFGSLFVMLFAFICTSGCYVFPIYSSFTKPDYFKNPEKPIWTWKTAFNKVQSIGNSMAAGDSSEGNEGAAVATLREANLTRGLDNVLFMAMNSTNDDVPYIEPNFYNSSFLSTEMKPFAEERKLNIRGGILAGLNQTKELMGFKSKRTPDAYFGKEYCERGADGAPVGVWKELCNFKHNVTNLECIDMMNGPAICVGIRNRRYEVFSVSKQCKFVDPEIPVEIFPTISDLCYNGNNSSSLRAAVNITKPICPCMITSSLVDNVEPTGIATAPSQNARDFIAVNRTNTEIQKLLQGPEGVFGNSFNSSLIDFAAKNANLMFQ